MEELILRYKKALVFILVSAGLFVGGSAFAQELHQEFRELVPATVLKILDERERDITGTDATALVQFVQIRVEGGLREGSVVEFETDLNELAEGDSIFVNRLETIDGVEYFELKDFDRRGPLISLAVIFIVLLVVFARAQGVRALLSLLISIGAILFILVPALLKGYPPVITSVAAAAVILAVVIFLTHGIKPRTTIAFIGTLSAVVVTVVIAELWVSFAKLTGFGSDVSVYLNIATRGALDLSGLLLGSIIIGVLGVLDDVAITQASVVQELKRANDAFGIKDLYNRALRVGRDHVSSLVNTLAFAYIGVSLPLVLLFARNSTSDFDIIINQEIIAAELVRTMVGSIGLILTVPLTTFIAAWWFARRGVSDTEEADHCGHAH